MMPDILAQLEAGLLGKAEPSSDYDLSPSARVVGVKLRPAAVLLAIEARSDGHRLHLTKRPAGMRHHPGQISFPGGKQEESDVDLWQTATREAHEELGVAPDQLRLLGRLPNHETVTGFLVAPYVAAMTPDMPIFPSDAEVEEHFSIPLAHVLNPDNYRIEHRMWQGKARRYYTVAYGAYYIWGATARICLSLASTYLGRDLHIGQAAGKLAL